MFTKVAKRDPSFTPHEQKLVARAAGQVMELAEKDSSRPYKARTRETRLSDSPSHSGGQDGASTRLASAQASEAA